MNGQEYSAIQNGMSYREAAKKYDVSHCQIYRKIKNPNLKAKRGPPTLLNPHDESSLSEWFIECVRKGYPRRRKLSSTQPSSF